MNKQIRNPSLTQQELKQRLNYDAESGAFTWAHKFAKNIVVGTRAGSKDNGKSYRYIRLKGKLYAEHRLVFLYVHGEWPLCQIDHINGVRDDNRLCNLRLAPNNHADNMQNVRAHSDNATGIKGVCKVRDKFKAKICVGYKTINLGTYPTITEAAEAYANAAKKYHTFNNF